jgi:phosphatidylinositol alpha-mannosyltransferase
VARVAFGPVAYARVRRWLVGHRFDVLHLHEPTTASISAIALLLAEGPVVATFHTATERSRALAALGGFIQPLMEKVTARIAVSPSARRVQVRHLGGDAVEIPNGVDVAALAPTGPRAADTVAFVGRFDEPRKGMPVLLDALARLGRPDLRLVVVGRGDGAGLPKALGHAAATAPARLRRRPHDESTRPAAPGARHPRVEVLGAVDDARKAAVLGAATVFCAPQTGGESFGIVLAEALAAGAPVLASDLDAFRAVLGDPPAGVLFRTGDPAALAAALGALLDDPARRAALSLAGRARAAEFDWSLVAADVERVYRAAVAADPRRRAS